MHLVILVLLKLMKIVCIKSSNYISLSKLKRIGESAIGSENRETKFWGALTLINYFATAGGHNPPGPLSAVP